MEESKITGASDILEISGKTYRSSPLTDRQLDFITNYVRYVIKKRAKSEAEFANSPAEAREIEDDAFNRAAGVQWFEQESMRILATPEGTAVLAAEMLKKEHPDMKVENLTEHFGSAKVKTDEVMENTVNVRKVFIEQNSLETGKSNNGKTKKKKSS